MKIRSVRFGVVLGLLLFSSIFTLIHRLGEREDSIKILVTDLAPKTLGEWVGGKQLVNNSTKERLGTDNALMRVYKRSGYSPVTLCITLGGATHPAEVCYEGQGWNITDTKEVELGLGETLKRISSFRIAKAGKKNRIVFVWYQTRDLETPSFNVLKWKMLMGSFFGGARWAAMVRLSCDDAPGATAAVTDFLSCFTPQFDLLIRQGEAP